MAIHHPGCPASCFVYYYYSNSNHSSINLHLLTISANEEANTPFLILLSCVKIFNGIFVFSVSLKKCNQTQVYFMYGLLCIETWFLYDNIVFSQLWVWINAIQRRSKIFEIVYDDGQRMTDDAKWWHKLTWPFRLGELKMHLKSFYYF